MKNWIYPLPDQCPPSSARSESITVYRLVETIPSTNMDWLPVSELNKSKPVNTPHREFDAFDECCSHGLSVFKTLDAIKRQRRRLKKKFGKYKIMVGTINENDGLILDTYSDQHVTWWLLTNTPQTTFKEVNENATV